MGELLSAATREVSVNITGVEKTTDETGHSAATVLDDARELLRRATELQQRVVDFLASVRSM